MTEVLEISFLGSIKVKMGINHMQPVRGKGTIQASELKVGDLIPFLEEPFKKKSLYEYRKVNKIEKINCNDENLYCLEVDSEDHLFMLENGMVTHNCRLRLDLSELRNRNGGYFGSGDSTGSVQIISINLPRLGHTA